jgi:ABC-type dipeptide/oligopeptide/nickel transport system permease component
MSVFVLKRLVQAAITFLIMTFMIFGLARLTGDPTPLVLPAEATEADRNFFREQYGLDRSIPEQYLVFLGNIAHGDFGISFRYRKPAIDIVLTAMGPTLELTFVSMVVAIIIGLPLGILAAVFRGSWIDRLVNIYSSIGQAVPTFWLGLVLIIAFAISWPIFPSTGYGSAINFVLPSVTLGFFASSSITRLTRANMEDALRSDFVHMERVLGLSQVRIVAKHALRNASLPIVTYLGLQFGLLLGGAIVTERVFSWPGIGQTIVDAIFNRDYPIIQAAVLTTAVFFILINTAVDILCMLLDPRVRG